MNYTELKKAALSDSPSSFPSNLDIFKHHFPGNSLLPGALSGVMLSDTCGGPHWSLTAINGLRFRKPLTPGLSISMKNVVKQETLTERTCLGSIHSNGEVIADGEFIFSKAAHPFAREASPQKDCIMAAEQIRAYLPHGEPIVLIDRLVTAEYPPEIQSYLDGNRTEPLDQSKMVGTKIHTQSNLKPNSFWLDGETLPLPILSELVAQAGALSLAPFFSGTKPQVSLLGCDTKYFGVVQAGATVDAFVELTRVKRLGKMGNMILFNSECMVGDKKIAQVNLNAMASF